VVNIARCCHDSKDYCTDDCQKNEGKNQSPEANDGSSTNDCADELCGIHVHLSAPPLLSASSITSSIWILGTTFGDGLASFWCRSGGVLEVQDVLITVPATFTVGSGRARVDASQIRNVALELRQFAKTGLRDDSAQRRRRLLERCPILRDLTPVQVAGADSRAQYEYLIQTIIDAVDLLGQTPTVKVPLSSVPPPSESAREADALRALFGLTGRSRDKIWRVRQEQAASSMSVTWDYFRHDLQDELLRSVAEQILRVASINRSPSIFDRKPGLWAFGTQNDIETEIIKYIQEERPQTAKMLEFSTATTGSILRALRDVGADIYLLAANPATVSGWHQSRMRRALADLLQIDLRDYDRLRLRLYGVPPSLRGRHIGEMVVLGWYTHRDNKRIEAYDPASVEVWGHDNAVVAGRHDEPDGAVLATWFSREFDRLWWHRSTLDEATSAGVLDTEP
jgi:hypothetical protein